MTPFFYLYYHITSECKYLSKIRFALLGTVEGHKINMAPPKNSIRLMVFCHSDRIRNNIYCIWPSPAGYQVYQSFDTRRR